MISILTIIQFLCFRESAQKLVLQSREVRLLGALFVLSAGFAREYDGEYLLVDWWYLLIPLAASLVGSFALTLLVWTTAWIRGVRTVGLLHTYGAILNAYWLTAPLAWLYAIPVERFLGESAAVRANLTLLAIVSIWRVAIMLRSLQILYRCRYWEALMPIMVFSLLVGYIAILMLPVPLFVVMGGVRVPESQQIIVDTRLLITLVAVVTSPVWLIGLIVVWVIKRRWIWAFDLQHSSGQYRVTRMAFAMGMIANLVWLPVLPWTQSEQFQRWTIEDLLARDDFQAAAAWSRGINPSMLPPHWIPPPRLTFGYSDSNAVRQSVAILLENAAPWYAIQCQETLKENLKAGYGSQTFTKIDLETLKGFITLQEKGLLDTDITLRLADMAQWTLDGIGAERSAELVTLLETMKTWSKAARSDSLPSNEGQLPADSQPRTQ